MRRHRYIAPFELPGPSGQGEWRGQRLELVHVCSFGNPAVYDLLANHPGIVEEGRTGLWEDEYSADNGTRRAFRDVGGIGV